MTLRDKISFRLNRLEGQLFSLPNIAVWTFGGRQVWGDTYYYRGWRIQENILTGHLRLLDCRDIRRAWGSYDSCLRALNQAKADVPDAFGPQADHLVIVLHGLGRTRQSMGRLIRGLRDGGLNAVALAYPSTRQAPAEHAVRLAILLENLEGVRTVSFVTHSLGGIVVRHLLALEAPWRRRLDVGGVVLIAPPNRGARLAALLKRNTAFRLLAGPAGQQLADPEGSVVPPLTDRHLVIAGVRGSAKGFNPLLEGDDDGVVSLAETDLGPNSERVLVKGIHTFIMHHPDTIRTAVEFLGRKG